MSTRHVASGDNSYLVQTVNSTNSGADRMDTYRADRSAHEDAEEQQVTLDVVGDGVTVLKDIVLETGERG